jgi:argininosuccinate synthase
MTRVVLAYSGGAETSAAIPWLAHNPPASAPDGIEIVAVILDLGRRAELVELRERALALGAVRCHVVDVREVLAGAYVLPALQAGVFTDARGSMTADIARPLVAKTLVDVARMEDAGVVAYGGSAGQHRAPLDALVASLNPELQRVAVPPARTAEEISANLWGRCVACAPDANVSEDAYVLTQSADGSPNRPAYLELEFQSGVPSRVNGIEMPLLEMIESLEIIGGTHGIGRTDAIVERADGSKWREIGEAPAARLLQLAQQEIQTLMLSAELSRPMEKAGCEYADLIRSGGWFSPAREALDAVIATIQPELTGSIRLRLFKGDCHAVPALVNS